ncbi:unnamed protein product [Sympodiomycopsis kandeliae]
MLSIWQSSASNEAGFNHTQHRPEVTVVRWAGRLYQIAKDSKEAVKKAEKEFTNRHETQGKIDEFHQNSEETQQKIDEFHAKAEGNNDTREDHNSDSSKKAETGPPLSKKRKNEQA